MYNQLLKDTKLQVLSSSYGQGLYSNQLLELGEELLEELPLISYILPARHFASYATQANTTQFCYSCMKRLDNPTMSVCCQKSKSNCLHLYCSQQCSQRHWIAGHWLLCLDNNFSATPMITALLDDSRLFSNYTIAEILAGMISKTIILLCNDMPIEQAVSHVFQPFQNLFGQINFSLQNYNLVQNFKKIENLFKFRALQNKLDFSPEIPQVLIDTFINFDTFQYIVSIVAFNGMSIVIDQELVGVGIFSVMSKCNHSCSPNSYVQFTENNSAMLVTEQPICQNQEILISYINDTLNIEERRTLLLEGWGFKCQCFRCKAEEIQ